MKKIFAIALALVMVFSMASAFAVSDCVVWGNNWPCDVDDNTPWCGKGKVEIVPLVKVNTACGWEYQVNTCAGAVRSEDIFYAVKLTVDAYPDSDWWNKAEVTVEFADGEIERDYNIQGYFSEETEAGFINLKSKKEVVYYHVGGGSGWIDLANDDDAYVAEADVDLDGELTFKDVAKSWKVVEGELSCGETWPDYDFCATLASYYDGGSEETYNKLGDYYYSFTEFEGTESLDEVEDLGAYEGTLEIWDLDKNDEPDNVVTFGIVDGALVDPDWTNAEAEFFNKVMADFGFNACGTAACITYPNIQANFGWNDSFEVCTSWSAKAAAIVDADCVVAIPKTGDVSVVAYAVMAVVAAAGAMLKK